MGSFVRRPGIMAGVVLAGAALTLTVPRLRLRRLAAVPGVINVPCNANALKVAISTANGGGAAVLALSANCTYTIVAPASATDGLPPITGNFALVGGGNTVIRRSTAALSSFRVLEVNSGASLRVSNLSIVNGKAAGLGGGILNGGTLGIRNVTFFKNMATNGGALSNSAGATAILDKRRCP